MTETLDHLRTVGAVVNPVSGDGNGEELCNQLAAHLEATVQKRLTSGPDDVPAAVREQADADLLVSIGGDGTLREVATTLVEIDDPPPIFVIPAGRGNSVYRHLYGDRNWEAVATGLDDGVTAAGLDVGRVSGNPDLAARFVLGFTAGLFRSAVVHAKAFDILPGPLAYVLGTGRAVLGDDPVRAKLTVDGERVYGGKARLFAVGGGRYRGSDFELFPDSRPGDGRVHALAVEPSGVRGSISLVRHAKQNRLREHPNVHHATGEQATLTAVGGLPVEMDGTPRDGAVTKAEIEMETPLTYARPTDWGPPEAEP